MLGVSASWLVQVGVGVFQFFKSKAKNENLSNDVRIRVLRQKVFLATVRCNASLIFASIGGGIGASLIRPSLGQWVGKNFNFSYSHYLLLYKLDITFVYTHLLNMCDIILIGDDIVMLLN